MVVNTNGGGYPDDNAGFHAGFPADSMLETVASRTATVIDEAWALMDGHAGPLDT